MLCRGRVIMKRTDLYYFITLALALFMIFGFPTINHKPKTHPIRPVTRQQLTSQLLVLKDKYGEDKGICTGTAIGPHAVMTAAHCNEHDDILSMSIDMSTETHTIISESGDGRDHVIMLLDGTAFKHISSVIQGTPKQDEVVTIYGDGGGEFPPVAKYGRVTNCQDPSDIDYESGIECTTLPVIPGDSGSAVFNSKGEIIGIVTYKDGSTNPAGEIGFSLNFTQKELNEAAEFDGKAEDSPANKMSLEDLLKLLKP